MKTMDIKSAFQLVQNRKRKSDADAITSEAKVLKRTEDIKATEGDKITKPSQSNCTETQVGTLSEQNKDGSVERENEHLDLQVTDTNTSDDESVLVLTSEDECSSQLESSILNSSLNKSIESSTNITVQGMDNTMSVADSSVALGCSNLLPQIAQKKRKRMSPEEAKRRTELRAEKEKLKEQKKEEALAKKQDEKDKKSKEKMTAKLEKQRKKEEEDREKEKLKQEKKEQDEKEKQLKLEERLKLKNLIQEAKAEVKKKKDEMKIKILEEKLKSIEEKKKMEEEKMKTEIEKEKKKAKTKQAFESFFLKSSTSSGSASSPQVQGKEKERVFLPFQVSDDMILAPIIPVAAKKRFDKERLDYHLSNQGCGILYVEALKSNQHQCVQLKKKKKDVESLINREVIEIGMESVQPGLLDLKAKLLQFNENIRPPYWGTFRKKSETVYARNPFGRESVFDYDVDSDEEWDEGGPGESLNGTEDDESEDDYEVDNEFFVPHGYLSAEEEGEDENMPEDPDAQQARLKLKEREFLSEHNKKTTQLKPVILGCLFTSLTNGSDHDMLLKSLSAFEAEDVIPVVCLQVYNNQLQSTTSSPNELNLQRTPSNMKRAVPEEALPYLLRLLHANTNGRQKVIKEFQHFWLKHCRESQDSQVDSDSKETKALIINDSMTPDMGSTPNTKGIHKISKRQLDMSITSVAIWCKPPHPTIKKLCWWVKEDLLVKYGLTDLPVPNEWKYTLCEQTEDSLLN